jgi:hypothetical protein
MGVSSGREKGERRSSIFIEEREGRPRKGERWPKSSWPSMEVMGEEETYALMLLNAGKKRTRGLQCPWRGARASWQCSADAVGLGRGRGRVSAGRRSGVRAAPWCLVLGCSSQGVGWASRVARQGRRPGAGLQGARSAAWSRLLARG